LQTTRVDVVGGLAFLDLPDRGPVSPDAGEAGEGTGLIECEPDVAALGLFELAERIEWHHASVLDADMPHYFGLNVSVSETAICVVDKDNTFRSALHVC
jgi:hypothetical protein